MWTKLLNTDGKLHKLAVKYQKLQKAKLDLQFLLDCKKEEVYTNFICWKNTHRRRKTQLLLKDATNREEIQDVQCINTDA